MFANSTRYYSARCVRPAVRRLARKHTGRSAFSSSLSSLDDMDDVAVTSPMFSSMEEFFHPTETHRDLRAMLRDFVKNEVEPQALEYNRTESFNLPLLRQLGDLGLLGLTVEEEYGGAALDAAAVVLAHEELSYSDPAFCLSYLAHSLLLVNNLSTNATPEQKARFLPKAVSGEHIGGMGMSEPSAGTDVLGMTTKAVLDSSNNTWQMTGQKMWITNGTLDGGNTTGDLFLVYARTGPERSDITSFVVEKDMPGFHVGQQIHDKLGMRASPTAELVFDNVPIPNENVIGNVNGATLCMMRNLEIERLGLAAMALGIARRSINVMKDYANDRKAFGKTLWDFGQIQSAISTSYAEYMAGRCYVYALANQLDLSSYGNGLDADGTKLYCAQMAKTVADRAIQALGGYGYVGEYNVERLWRDAKLLEIGGGTNESHHKNMARDLRRGPPLE
ncbi:isovaleryl-CoA dehydrogenase [Nitzschia inconspicua]|uniref:Isovaleryl-CoA dehydrogenase n=1 Tax=Nitzschia inconspicua TaxID=303405 RepID=A0A9K3KWE0_9STRA|nr:isovaleryl-CoA dehydrogenase [Nitzschia inconspicua]